MAGVAKFLKRSLSTELSGENKKYGENKKLKAMPGCFLLGGLQCFFWELCYPGSKTLLFANQLSKDSVSASDVFFSASAWIKSDKSDIQPSKPPPKTHSLFFPPKQTREHNHLNRN